MIQRYTRKAMDSIWSLENRFQQMLKVEKTVASVQAKLGLIPSQAATAINKKGTFSLKTISTLEKKTKHDVAAFVQNVSSKVGSPWGKFVHYGLTSSDVLDTALSLQIKEASKLIQKEVTQLKKTLKNLIQKHKNTLCAGRTHGMHAEPTTFGFKLLGFLSELTRAETDFQYFIKEGAVGTLSGPVGTYTSLPLSLEKQICQKLKLKPDTHSTQVIPRDRHARVIFSLTLILSCLERLAIELRHLQRTEVSEIQEGFSKNQQGSSSMPHKKNPISAENITGLARLLRSHLQASLENTPLWHERDISHSSVERVIFPDAFILCDYALNRMTEVLKNLQVNTQKMKDNVFQHGGDIFSSQILLGLIQKGVDRQRAYSWIQKASHTRGNMSFQKKLEKNPDIRKYLTQKDLNNIFSGEWIANKVGKLVSHKLSQL